jgi:hypothetical protein
MNIDKLTITIARQIAGLFSGQKNSNPYRIGANYFVRTVTHHHTGRLVEVTQQELVLEDVCWIADSGRWADALKSCEFTEVEPFPKGRVIIGRGSVIDAVEIKTLPTDQK